MSSMTADLPSARNNSSALGIDFFLARQPILNRDEQLVAHELLFRNADVASAGVNEDLFATASVIAHLAELGLEQVAGQKLAFVNIDAAALHSGILGVLPRDQVILEILETVEATPELLEIIGAMRADGYTFALDDVVAMNDDVRRLLPMVDVVKVDIMGMPRHVLGALVRGLKAPGRRLLAEKVESVREFNHCLGLGFDLFQGYYFARPIVMSGKKLTPSELAILSILDLLERDADHSQVAQAIKHDALLSVNLLRLVNTVAYSGTSRIDSLPQALMLLGQKQLKRWLQILLFAKAGKGGAFGSPLLSLATTRARLLELIAERQYPGQAAIAQTAFTVGIMSLMDTLFSMPMDALLEKIKVAPPVREALLQRSGTFGDLLRVAEQLEMEGTVPAEALQKIGLPAAALQNLQLGAFEWANKITQVS